MNDRDQVAAVMVAAMSGYSEQYWAAGWLIGLEKMLFRSDEPFAQGLHAIARRWDVWPVLSDDGGYLVDGYPYHLLTYDEARQRYEETT